MQESMREALPQLALRIQATIRFRGKSSAKHNRPLRRRQTITRQMKQGLIFLSPLLYQQKPEFWHLPADFDKVDQEMEEAARDAGLGVLTLEEKVKFWREAIEKKRSEIEEMGIKVPAIPELGVEGEVVQVKKNETIATSF